MAKKGFAIFNAQWNSYWHGKVARRLAMALNMMIPTPTTEDAHRKLGIGEVPAHGF